MVNYQLGKIYRLVCNTTGKTYIGSTCKPSLRKRLAEHKNDYNKWKKGTRLTKVSSFEIFDENNYDIILLENFPCNSKDELHARERFYIENHECVNKIIPTRTRQEYFEDNKEKIQEQNRISCKSRYEKNKNERLQKQKEYTLQHKEEIKQYQVEYREKNREKLRQYYHLNKSKIQSINNLKLNT